MKIEGNIKQLFYIDIIDTNRWIQKGFDKDGIKFEDREIKDIQGTLCTMKYAIIRFNKNAQGQSQASGKGGVVKIGYSCRPSITRFPIFLTYPNDANEYCIYIGKTGLFESQTDTWMDVNNEDPKAREEQVSVVEVTSIAIPWAYPNGITTFNEFESIIDYVESTDKEGTYNIKNQPDPYNHSIKPIVTNRDFSCRQHIIAYVDSEDRFIFKVKAKEPSLKCNNCQEGVHATVNANNETAYFYIDDSICKQHIYFSGARETFSVNFI